jgi:hypothetical protein
MTRMKFTVTTLTMAGALVFGIPASAHHSFAATYFEDKEIKIEGDIVQFLYRNPHSFVQVEVKEPNGQVTRWAIEWAAGGQLSQGGITRDTLRPGDHIIITANPGRNPDDHRARMVGLNRPSDGLKWGSHYE